MINFQNQLEGKPCLFFRSPSINEIEGPGVKKFGKNFGVIKLKLPNNQLDNKKTAIYCNSSPSFFNKGHILNNAILFIHETIAISSVFFVEYNNVIGNNGTSIDFS